MPLSARGTTLYANNVDTASSWVFTGGLVWKPASAIAIHLVEEVDAFPDLSPKPGSDHCMTATRVGTNPNTCVSTAEAIKEDERDEKI
jgi:hypothetical protein